MLGLQSSCVDGEKCCERSKSLSIDMGSSEDSSTSVGLSYPRCSREDTFLRHSKTTRGCLEREIPERRKELLPSPKAGPCLGGLSASCGCSQTGSSRCID